MSRDIFLASSLNQIKVVLIFLTDYVAAISPLYNELPNSLQGRTILYECP